MKSRSIRDLILFCMIGVLVLGAMLFMADRQEGSLPAYSVLNKSNQGFSVYLEALQALGVEARQINGPVVEQPTQAIQVVAYAWWFDTTEPAVLKWVQSGGILVLTAPEPPVLIRNGKLISEKNGIKIWQVGNGRILTIPAAHLTNRALTKDTVPSWTLTEALMAQGDRPVLFNEENLFSDKAAPSLWKAAPLWLKLGVYQLLLVAAAWFWMKGSRLGRPLPFVTETERVELEYLRAAAHFYRAAGCWHLMLGAYYRSLIRLLGAREEDWLKVWIREGLPESVQAEALHIWMGAVAADCPPKEIQQQIIVIEHLKETVRNRRHNPWSTTKHR